MRLWWLGPLFLLGCQKPPSTAPEGERAVVRQPVGPIPGVGELPPVENPLGDGPEVIEKGRRLFVQYNCAGCHGGHGGGGMGPSLRDPRWLYGNTPDKIFNSIAEGRAHGMPSWGTRLPDEQIWELVAYIKSFRTDKEAEPPR